MVNNDVWYGKCPTSGELACCGEGWQRYNDTTDRGRPFLGEAVHFVEAASAPHRIRLRLDPAYSAATPWYTQVTPSTEI
jgi:hypothetical protein